jgi:serine beta-lactamase-like protein LACTB, mitochondrial
MKLNPSKIIVIIFFVFFIYQNTFPQSEKTKLFENYITEYFNIKKVPSISAGVLRDGKIVWLGVKGKADLEEDVPATINSLYRIASITKPITAVAIMQLYEKGIIDLDKDARIYMPAFPQKKWKFTVRQLLNHTSGIRGYKDGEFDSKVFYSSTAEAIKVFAYDTLDYEPGTKYEYSTLAYSLLARIIENVSKTTFEDYLIKNIFIPAEMHDTFVDKQKDIIPNRVKGYEKNFLREFQNAPLADLSIKVAGGGLLSNSRDLLLFAKALLDGKLIKMSTLDMMCKRDRLKSGRLLEYGLGFALSFKNDSLKAFYHVGGGTGFVSMLLINPIEKLATVDLINIKDRNLGLPAQDLANIELGLSYLTPSKTISDELMSVYRAFAIDSTISRYYAIVDSNLTQYNLSENEIVNFTKDLTGLNKSADAIKFLKSIVVKFPNSFTYQVALADAYLQDQNEGLAIKCYRAAWQINKDDPYVNKMIRQLSKK